MSKPRVFLSSTFYDLKQIRVDLDRFINDLGYECIRNESGNITYGNEEKLEEYCYKTIMDIDFLVGIIGGKFGSESNNSSYSITQTEIITAIKEKKQVYLFIEKNVHSEYSTYLLNKSNTINYRYIDNIKIYEFIDEIMNLPRNNVIHPFENTIDIVSYLKYQWAGLFRELLVNKERMRQIDSINNKVNELSEVSNTLKTYIENLLKYSIEHTELNPMQIIEKEDKRLYDFHIKQLLLDLTFINHLIGSHGLKYDDILNGLKQTNTLNDLRELLTPLPEITHEDGTKYDYTYECFQSVSNRKDLNIARKILGLQDYIID